MQDNADAEEPESLMNALDEPVSEPPQQIDLKRKRGRPRKSRLNDEEQEQASELPRKSRPNDEEQKQASEVPRRKRGRPSNAEREAEARRLDAQEIAEESVVHAGPLGVTDELSPTSPPQVTRIATSRNRRLQRPTQTTAGGPNAAPLISSGRPRQESVDQIASQSGSDSRHQITVDDEDEPLFVENVDTEHPDIIR